MALSLQKDGGQALQKDGGQALQKDGGPQYDITYLRGRQARKNEKGVKPALDS